MWPKVLAQLFELLPHISRVVPLADRYLSTRSSTDTAITTMATDVRSDLGRVAKAHMDLAERLDQFAGHVDGIAAEARQTRAAAQNVEVRITALERHLGGLRLLLFLTLAAVLLCAALLVILLLHAR